MPSFRTPLEISSVWHCMHGDGRVLTISHFQCEMQSDGGSVYRRFVFWFSSISRKARKYCTCDSAVPKDSSASPSQAPQWQQSFVITSFVERTAQKFALISSLIEFEIVVGVFCFCPFLLRNDIDLINATTTTWKITLANIRRQPKESGELCPARSNRWWRCRYQSRFMLSSITGIISLLSTKNIYDGNVASM